MEPEGSLPHSQVPTTLNALHSFKISGITRPVTQHQIQED